MQLFFRALKCTYSASVLSPNVIIYRVHTPWYRHNMCGGTSREIDILFCINHDCDFITVGVHCDVL